MTATALSGIDIPVGVDSDEGLRGEEQRVVKFVVASHQQEVTVLTVVLHHEGLKLESQRLVGVTAWRDAMMIRSELR